MNDEIVWINAAGMHICMGCHGIDEFGDTICDECHERCVLPVGTA